MDKKIGFIINSVNQGGIEIYLLRFLENKKGNFRPYVIYNRLENNLSLYNDYLKTGAKMLHLPVSFSPIKFYKFYKFLRKENISTICDFRGDFSGIVMFISWLVRVENRLTFYRESQHQFKASFIKNIYASFMNFLVVKFSNKILSNSKIALDNFFNKNTLEKKYIRIIRNGVFKERDVSFDVDIRTKYDIPKEGFLIGHVGRFTLAKNHSTILKVAKELINKDQNIYFLLCGKGVDEKLKNEIKMFDSNNRVIALGLCSNIPSHLKSMDVFLFPSLNEGQPNALIEAMLENIPVVSSDIESIKETVHEDMYNSLFNPLDFESLIHKIIEIKQGDFSYDLEKIKLWTQKEYNQDDKFDEFYNELISKFI
tara:strand:- start:3681 stop:4787 length:1107 start_codon:yes stop_codon:yes gene_type:complete